MTTTESLMLAQTIVLAVTAGVVAWYSWETRKIRKVAVEQLEKTDKQLQVLLNAQKPVFSSAAGQGNFRGRRLQIKNVGGLATQITVTADPKLLVDAPSHLARDEQRELYIRTASDSESLPKVATFSLTCNDVSGLTHKLKFQFFAERDGFEEIHGGEQ